jgi:hypothetical protein
MAPPSRARWFAFVLFLPLLCVTSCMSRPVILFQQVPVASAGGSDTNGLIRGKVIGRHRGRRIVVYALDGGRWWVQPFAYAPFTPIGSDGTWSAQIHLGAEYAALLTSEGVQPVSVLDSLPPLGNGVEAIATASGTRSASAAAPRVIPGPILRFRGYDWQVRNIPGDYTAKTNPYSPRNVFLDDRGSLHLRLTRSGDEWTCAEVHSVRFLGYGIYRFGIRDLGQLEPAAMFSTFTHAENGVDRDYREMDIHMTQWGDVLNKNAEYVVQPYFVPADVYRFDIPPGFITTQMEWSPERARFSSWKGDTVTGKPVSTWTFTPGVPASGGSQIYINFCTYGYAKIKSQHEAEVVVDQFEFFP